MSRNKLSIEDLELKSAAAEELVELHGWSREDAYNSVGITTEEKGLSPLASALTNPWLWMVGAFAVVGVGANLISGLQEKEKNIPSPAPIEQQHTEGKAGKVHTGIGNIATGQEVCTVPWAVKDVDKLGTVIDSESIYTKNGFGTFQMQVIKTGSGFEIITPEPVGTSDVIPWQGATKKDLIPVSKVTVSQDTGCV